MLLPSHVVGAGAGVDETDGAGVGVTGCTVGEGVGARVGTWVGAGVGIGVGIDVGIDVGRGVGMGSVGAGDGVLGCGVGVAGDGVCTVCGEGVGDGGLTPPSHQTAAPPEHWLQFCRDCAHQFPVGA